LHHVIKDLKPNTFYSFRVCCKYTGKSDVSAWSVVQSAKTTIPPYSWKSTENFQLNYNQKIITSHVSHPMCILSNGPQFLIGQTINFIILEIGEESNDNYFGLLESVNLREHINKLTLDDIKKHSFLISSNGEIFVNGNKTSTKMPNFFNNCKITFNCTALNSEKVRMNVDMCDKRVTYDWNIDTTQPLHFLSFLTTNKWKIYIE